MSLTASGRSTWDEASSPAASRLVGRFEADWRAATGRRPEPADYLPADPDDRLPALLALLRADLALRWEAGERAEVEAYRDRYPGLGDEALVALIYEEFCLREEAGESPAPEAFAARFPEQAEALRRVLEIHDLVGSAGTVSFPGADPTEVPLPEAGQTIAGFHLVEELGRGTFARVFRARERQLADRPVALKVARAGSREPQTLARLQHTHIVPVHSYRTDPVTGLHLLCMPYFGRVTLAQILDDLTLRPARSGADLVAALDRLQPSEATGGRSAGRTALASRSYARAVAWWGARLAEGLQHAHDRGVLHRDIKPSNVLVTADGMPMLLDFNLASGPRLDDPEAPPEAPGGTLAYMAPEHLEALADGCDEHLDGRADVYALGVVLFEALTGARPFPHPAGALTVAEALRRAAATRREGPPHPTGRPVPAELAAVLRTCLAADPADRYASAAELAADLQAVADDGPPRVAREPQPGRTLRWLRRRARPLAAATAALAALGLSGWWVQQQQAERFGRVHEAERLLHAGEMSAQAGRYDLAIEQFQAASKQIEHDARRRKELWDLRGRLAAHRQDAIHNKTVREQAARLFEAAEDLRFDLLGFGAPLDEAELDARLLAALGEFRVFQDPDWDRAPLLAYLDDGGQAVIGEVNELLFLAVVTRELGRDPDPARDRNALQLCDWALRFARPEEPWRALRASFAARLGQKPPPEPADNPAAEPSARACFQWSLLCDQWGRPDRGRAWLERAVQIEPGQYWYQYDLALHLHLAGHDDRALAHLEAAIALRPDRPWALFQRAQLYWQSRGAWDRAREDLRTLAAARGASFPEAYLELGLIGQRLGDLAGAWAAYRTVLAAAPRTSTARDARLNLATLSAEAGFPRLALAAYDRLLARADPPGETPGATPDPAVAQVRLGRALVLLRLGRAAEAEAEFDALIAAGAGAAEAALFDNRARARLLRGEVAGAQADAVEAYQRGATPGRMRLWRRVALAAGNDQVVPTADPDELDLWPVGGAALAADLRAAEVRLRAVSGAGGEAAVVAQMRRAVVLAALGDRLAAEAVAGRAIAAVPGAAYPLAVRAALHRRAGDREAALADLHRAIALSPDVPDLHLALARTLLEAGQPSAALAELDRALLDGAPEAEARATRARALIALGRTREALDDWSRAMAGDPDDPRLALGRATGWAHLGEWDQALADLERAADRARDCPGPLARTTLVYASCLPARPDRAPRVLALAGRTLTTAIRSLRPRPAPAALGTRDARPLRGSLDPSEVARLR